MSKNLTLKGAAFGALVALSISAVAPASAAGLADNSYVSLAPASGTEYTVVAGAGKTFSLTANEASTVAGGNLKFLVSDASDLVEVATGTTGRTAFTVDQTSGIQYTAVASTDVVTVIKDASTVLAVGDYISFASALDANGATAGVVQAANTPVKVTAVTSTTSFAFKASADIAADVSSATTLDGTDSVTTVVAEARNTTDHNFVVDTGSNSASSNSTLALKTTESTVVTRSVDVTAWVDSNGNDTLDTTEYASPTRTVVFKKASEITATLTTDALVAGATSIVAHVATTPALNGNQMSNGDVNALFTYQGSNVEFTPATSAAVFNTTTRAWDITATRSGSISAAANVASDASVLTSNGHGLIDGETVTIAGTTAAGGTTTGVNGTKTVASSTANTFSVSAGSGTGAVSLSSATWTVQVKAGSYSVRPKIGSDYLAAASSLSVGAVTSASGAAAVAETKDINSTVSSGNATAVVRPDTLAASATWTFKDADTATVTAGRPVKLTVTTVTGVTGLKINGKSAAQGDVIDLTTSAAGTVSAAVTVTAGVNGNSVVLTAVAEGVSATSKTATFNWTTGTNTLYDLNGQASLQRSIAKGGSYTFDFAVTDTWSQLVTGDYRLKAAVSGNTVAETYTSISSGRASVTVKDDQIGTSAVTVVVTPQKKQTDGTWATTGAPNAITYVLNPTAQSGAAVTAISADATADFSTDAVVAGDTRLVQTDVTGDGTAGTDAVEITGVVTDSLTGVVKPGAAVTLSASGLLFVDGTKSALGSITTFADASGAYSVHVRSNKAGVDTEVTASALGATKTLKVTFLKAKRDTATTATIVAVEKIATGKTFAVTVKLTDKFGNAVVTDSAATGYQAGSTAPTFKVTYDGPGFVTSTIPAVTDADGQIKFVVLLGAGDTGAATISAAYDSNGATDNVAGTTLVASATKTVLIGVSASVSAGSKKANVVVKNASGLTVKVVSGTKSTTKTATSDSYKLSLSKLTSGSKTVKVYVQGILVASKKVTVKR